LRRFRFIASGRNLLRQSWLICRSRQRPARETRSYRGPRQNDDQDDKMTISPYRIALVMIPGVLIAGLATWLLIFSLDESDAQTDAGDTSLQTAVTSPGGAELPSDVATKQPSQSPPATAERLGHLSIVRQSFQRGGLGSKALVTFTLRNDNDYAVKDPQLLCAFRSKDGYYSTERRRIIHDTLTQKSRKTFPSTLVGFVNVKASQARCSVLTASRG
jgi:hypothetical protein